MPAGDIAAWRTDPWALTGVNGYLYGRGATDDKGPILATVFAVKELLEEGAVAGKGGKGKGRGGGKGVGGSTGSGDSGEGEGADAGGLLDHLNVVFLYEGEEESSSEGFRSIVQVRAVLSHRFLRKCSFCTECVTAAFAWQHEHFCWLYHSFLSSLHLPRLVG